MPLCCPDNSETLSGCCRNQCPDAAEICILAALGDKGIQVLTRADHNYPVSMRSKLKDLHRQFCTMLEIWRF